MMRYFLTLSLGLTTCFLAAGNALASSIIIDPPNIKTTSHLGVHVSATSVNSVRLRCYISENIGKSSRAIVLQISPSNNLGEKFDFAVTTAHGLLDGDGNVMKDCQVNLPGSKNYKVKAHVIAPNYQQGQSSDWAIIAFDKLKSKAVIRHQVSADMSDMAVEEIANKRLSVFFSKARGLPHNGQTCTLLPRQFAGLTQKKHVQLLAHNCRSIAGQSGSPISIMRNNHAVVLGMHVGSSMIYAHPTPSSPLRHQGYMRVIDQDFMTTFAQILPKIEADLNHQGDK